jgi:hypothetical protein
LRAAAFRAEDGYGGRLEYLSDGLCARRLPKCSREAGLTQVSIRALSESTRAPLSAEEAQTVRSWMLGPFAERIRPDALPAVWERFAALWEHDAAASLIDDPDFFLVRTAFLVSGRKLSSDCEDPVRERSEA